MTGDPYGEAAAAIEALHRRIILCDAPPAQVPAASMAADPASDPVEPGVVRP